MAGREIEQFKREMKQRRIGRRRRRDDYGSDLLREVMNTVGKARPARREHSLRRLGLDAHRRLGHEHGHAHSRRSRLRHAIAVRTGRRPRRCAASPTRRTTRAVQRRIRRHPRHSLQLHRASPWWSSRSVAPKPITRIQAVKERAQLEIAFPRVEGYRVDLPKSG